MAVVPLPIHEEWLRRAESALKGILNAEKFAARKCEGIELRPIYRAEDVKALPHLNSLPGFSPFVRGVRAAGYLKDAWTIVQEVSDSDPGAFNRTARADLERGATGLAFSLGAALPAKTERRLSSRRTRGRLESLHGF